MPAVEKRKVPIFFLQPTNGKSVEPVIVLSEKAARSGDKEFQAALFPPVPGAKTELVPCGPGQRSEVDRHRDERILGPVPNEHDHTR